MKRLPIIFFLLVLSGFAQEIRRPTADSDNSAPDCFGTAVASASGANAYDGSGTSTSVAYTASGTSGRPGTSRKTGRLFATWATPSGAYSALTLNVNSSCTDDAINAGGECFISYSTNGGATWTALISDSSSGGWGQVTTTVTLSAGQDLTQLQVRACADGFAGDLNLPLIPGTGTVTLFDVWTSGTLAPPSSKPRHRIIETLAAPAASPYLGLLLVFGPLVGAILEFPAGDSSSSDFASPGAAHVSPGMEGERGVFPAA